ncbi:MAG: DsbA family oxidoreductase [Acidimicrobiales bacterium]
MQVEIWSDIVCPWCYIGKRRFEAALGRFEHADEVQVTWRSFELDPRAPFRPGRSMIEHLASKYGRTQEQAREMLAQMDRMAAGEGLDYHLQDTTGGNTFDAHRLIHLAGSHGRGPELKEALLHAYFIDCLPASDPDVLVRVAGTVGLDEQEVRDVLDSDRFAQDVRADEQAATDYGATGVPFFVFDRAYAVPGAQEADVFLDALRRTWDRSHPTVSVIGGPAGAGAGAACTGDACDL